MPKTVAIMQPTYLPWLGYLALIARVDQFVFLDTVQFDHRSWQQRNRIKTNTDELLLTIPVQKKGLLNQNINQVQCIDLEKQLQKHLKSIERNYAKAPFFKLFFKEYSNAIESSFERANNSLADLNIHIINFLCDYAHLSTSFLRSSNMNAQGQKDEFLANINSELKATHYLSPPGSKDYLEGSLYFKKKQIEIQYHDYKHPIYPQLHGEFVEGMSSIDAFFNVPQDKLKQLIISGIQ